MKKLDLTLLKSLLHLDEIDILKKKLRGISNKLDLENDEIKIIFNGKESYVSKSFFLGEVHQILQTRTLQRSKYYLNRLIKSLTEVKNSKINDLNLNRWKEYDDLITYSLWIMDKRDKSGAHSAG